uniref:Biopolymer transport protein TolA n=1 Tax=Dechloromonas aromatica (strain RCB) TaxID=159087 RepID=Q47K10_DECAR
MENRSLSVVAGLITLLAMPLAALAAESGTETDQQASWRERLDKASALQIESKALKEEGLKRNEQKYLECEKKFLVNSCRIDADREYQKTTHEARRLEAEGKALEREVKKEQLADRDKRRAEEAPSREADMQMREAETAASRQASELHTEAVRSDKAKKAAEGAKRKAEQAEKHRQKQEAHDAKVAAKKLEAERRAAEDGEKK